MSKPTTRSLAGALALALLALSGAGYTGSAQEQLPWGPAQPPRVIVPGNADGEPPVYQYPPQGAQPRPGQGYGQPYGGAYAQGQPPAYGQPPVHGQGYQPPQPLPYQQQQSRYNDAYRPPQPQPRDGYAPPPPPAPYARSEPYHPHYGPNQGPNYGPGHGSGYQPPPPAPNPYEDEDRGRAADGTFSMAEIRDAGHQFFGSVSQGLASVIEYAFRRQGRPNGYILGEDVGGAFVAGLRYGEGWLHTRDAGRHKVYWQGPSLGYDAGAEGSRVLVLVYNLRDPQEIYRRFGGIAGSAYVVGGVGLTFQKAGDIVLAPIRSGVGLRLGANIGYLHYTRRPTWNPF